MARRRESRIVVVLGAACLVAIVVIGCRQSWVEKIGSEMDVIAKGYEKFGTVSISSPILVEARKDEKGYFDFELEPGPDQYYEDARTEIQSQSAVHDKLLEMMRFGLTVRADIPALMGYIASLQEYGQKLAAYQAQRALLGQAAELEAQKIMAELPDNASEAERKEALARAARIRAGVVTDIPPFPTPPKTPPPALDKDVAPSAKAGLDALGGKSSPKAGAPSGNDLKVPNRSAITTAAGDTVTEGIFRLLGNPAEAMDFDDKYVLFGVSMVTVSPGWLTRTNYTGELAVSVGYDYDIARRELLVRLKEKEEAKNGPQRDQKLIELIDAVLKQTPMDESKANSMIPERFKKKTREEYTPLCAAVSPMTDVETLDLASSQLRMKSNALRIAAALSGAGSEAQAEFFKQWARRTEQDVHTRTAYAAITAFSNGGFFGFRIRPRLKAIEDAGQSMSKPENVLEHQAFPVLVVVVIDKDDLQLGFDVARDEDGEPNENAPGQVTLAASEPLIYFRETASWLPNRPTSNSKDRLSETERLRWAHSYMKAAEYLKLADCNSTDKKLGKFKKEPHYLTNYEIADFMKRPRSISDYEIIEFAENRLDSLEYHTLDSWNSQYIPMELMTRD